jgi:hypothetical protein
MSDRTTLGFLEAIAREAELPGIDRPLVLPAVHDAVGREEPLLDAFAKYHGGILIKLGHRPPGAPGPLNHARVAIAQAIFGTANLDLRYDEAAGRITASFSRHASPSGGLATALRVAESFASEEIDAPVVFLTYALDGMDSAVAHAVWDLLGLAISDAPPSALRVWVPIAEGDVDVRRHCTPANPVRLAVQNDRLIVRGAATAMGSALSSLLLARDQPLVLFLGAGASASAGISMGDAVRSRALQHVTGHAGSTDMLVDAFRTWVASRDRWRNGEQNLTRSQFVEQLTLERVLREEFHELGGLSRRLSPTVAALTDECNSGLLRLPPGRQALRRLVVELPRLVLATVNFDRQIEDGLGSPHQVISTPEAMTTHRGLICDRLAGNTDIVPILKLHGSIEDPDNLIADIENSELGLPDEVAATLDAMLSPDNVPLTWVWIGCSMRDADLKAWLRRKNGATELREWWADPLPSQSLVSYARYVRAAQWASLEQTLRNRLVTETADTFLPALLDRAISLPAI